MARSRSYWGECRTRGDLRSAAYQQLREGGVLPEHARRMSEQIADRASDDGRSHPLTVAVGGTSSDGASDGEVPRPYLPLPHCLLEG